MRTPTILFLSLSSHWLVGQVAAGPVVSTYLAQTESSAIALEKAKEYLVQNVLAVDETAVAFVLDPLHSSTTGDLTTLVYECEARQISGLILAFFGNYWNEAGVVYKGYGFKRLEVVKANEFLKKVKDEFAMHEEFLRADGDHNHIAFSYEDIKVVMWVESGQSAAPYRLRLFWNGFDALWYQNAHEKTSKRLMKALGAK